ncbi:AMP-binding protein [Pararhodobacter oceanensis]|uniref:AMP-dependent synthetase n=1 Tax=Pararhodobacter oceanensis TaxID=2172121 RepID=A0A2T8HXE5_9RHOB|nr:AMP-dependent synthetase [Pararhodobacter oceanensis]
MIGHNRLVFGGAGLTILTVHTRDTGAAGEIPEHLNMARQACFDWLATPERLAITDLSEGARRDISYGELARMTSALANHLAGLGVSRGDRVAVLRAQDPWTAAAHLAIWSLGAVSLPLFKLFGPDALSVRLADSGAQQVICDAEGAQMVQALEGGTWQTLIPDDLPLHTYDFLPVNTASEDPAVLIYTSGTTGAPKGALHAHRVLSGHIPGVVMSHDGLGQSGDAIWSPADWAWIGGLFDVLMPGLALGVPVIAARLPKFTAEAAREVIRAGNVRNVFFPPTALKMLKAADMALPGLRSVASGGEPLGAEMLDWGQRAFGLSINEFYGQTECNMIVSSAASQFPARPGCIGKPVPGHELAILGPDGPLAEGEEGDIAVRRGSPSMMLGYWNRPEETAAKFREVSGETWLITGDRGQWEDGYIRFVGRDDDVITSAGYRIGPSEIEDCLLRHPAVAMAAVIGVPDPERTERVRAYVVLKDGMQASEGELKTHVRTRVSAHLVPREVFFETTLPMTVTGKIIRKDLKRRAVEEGA